MADVRETQVAELVAPIVSPKGVDVEYVTLRRAGRRTVVVVALDSDGGITLDDVADYSRDISEALDAAEVMGEAPYTLEVTSPGVHRPLTLARHWRRAAARLVRVQMADGTTIEGRILDSDDTHVDIDVSGATRHIAMTDIDKAVVQVEFPKETG
jgi:ribosome maturation factor RimP